MRSEKTVVADMDPPIKIGTWMLRPSNPHPAVVCDEVYVVTDCHVVTDGYQIRLAAEGEQFSTEYLHTLAYFGTLSAEVSNRIAAQLSSIHSQSHSLTDHRYVLLTLFRMALSLLLTSIDDNLPVISAR